MLNSLVLQPAATNVAVGVGVMKKANDAQASAALSLLQALPPVPQYNNPTNLGNAVDTKA
ncbi:YjfB family protein [Silvimonas soli]|uniref:YjfB family protein n=1 Tax=Silvimonas soli TaxID=2980100 RepID=UPI0024B3AC22|nr:YjfB family protein [Silvimonas soli]